MQKKLRKSDIRKTFPNCIYCGDAGVAETIDHAPPISLFENRKRPDGLMFSSCRECNQRASVLDQTMAVFSRTLLERKEAVSEELRKYVRQLRRNHPEIASAIGFPRTRSRKKRILAKNGLSSDLELLECKPPIPVIVSDSFARQIFALSFDFNHRYFTSESIVRVKYFTNISIANSQIREGINSFVGGRVKSLEMGKFSVPDQFSYSVALLDEIDALAVVVAFRTSMIGIGIVEYVESDFTKELLEWSEYRVGFLKNNPLLDHHFHSRLGKNERENSGSF
jgi:hypothetical protein